MQSTQPCQSSPCLWLDVTTLLAWQGKANGIPRMLSSIMVRLKDLIGDRLRLCCYQPLLKRFVNTTWEAIPPHFRFQEQAVDNAGAEEAKQSKASGLICTSADGFYRWCLARLPQGMQRPAGELIKETLASSCRLYSKITRNASTLPLLGRDPASFSAGDTLLVIGVNWTLSGYMEQIAKLKSLHGVKFAPVCFDLIPTKFPHFVQDFLPLAFEAWIKGVLQSADNLITISNCARQDLLEFAGARRLATPPIHVIRLGDELPSSIQSRRPACITESMLSSGFATYISTVDPRKNHTLLYHVWQRLVREHGDRMPSLMLPGHWGFHSHIVQYEIRNDPVVKDKVLLMGSVDDAEIEWLYQNCLFTLYPSHYEGWGLPVAESLARGKYCIASNNSSIPEVGGSLVDYHDSLDFEACKQLVQRACFDSHYRSIRQGRVRNEYRSTSWQTCALKILEILKVSQQGVGAVAA